MRNVIVALIVISIAGLLWLGFARRSDPDGHGKADIHAAPYSSLVQKETMENLSLTSTTFTEGGMIPSQYTCDGANINPPMSISGVPKEAKSLVLIMDDPDAPRGTWDHWVKFNISPTTTAVEEGKEPEGASGVGSSGNRSYKGPCPPDREHRYFFKLYALDTVLDAPEGSSKQKVEEAMQGHILQLTELMGRYDRKR